jgi:hypothetical protein
VVAPENSVREVNDINARNTVEVRTHAAAFGINFLSQFKIRGGAPDTREVNDINARNTVEVRTHAAAFGISFLT